MLHCTYSFFYNAIKRPGILCFLLISLIACDSTQSTDTTSSPTEMEMTPSEPVNVVREVIEVDGVPTPSFAPASRCEDTQGDDELFTCVEEQFWRVFQRDIEHRFETISWMSKIEDRLVEEYKLWSDEEIAQLNGTEPEMTSLQKKYARMVFQRGQLATAYVVEQQDVALASRMQVDFELSLRLHPTQPFYQIWLDTVIMGLAELLERFNILNEAIAQSWLHVENYTEETTRSTLVASLVGTAAGMPMNTQAPDNAADLVRNWACSPEELEANPDRLCGAHSLIRPCLEWCRVNSEAAPFKAPGLAYHDGEVLARVGDLEGARRMYELAKTMPGFEGWPYRSFVDNALADMDAHIEQFTSLADDEDAFNLVYTNTPAACVFCHVAPSRIVSR